MTRIAFIVFAFTFPVPVPYLIVAFLVVAIVIFIGAILLLRNTGKKKKANANKSGGAAWQPQGQQQGMPGGWNQQGQGMVAPADNAWGQQQPGAWAAQPPAQQQPGAWGAQAPIQQQPGAWAAQPPAQQQPGAWGAQQPAQQPGAWAAQPPAQQQSSPWGSPSTPSSNAANLPGGQGMGGGQTAWDATFAPQQSSAPSQDQWKQAPVSPVEQGASVWGMQNNNPAQQQAPTSYGGGNSGQSWGQANQSAQPADPWSTSSAQQSAPAQQGWGQPQSPSNPSGNPGMPSWQQGPGQGQGFGSPAAGNAPGGQVAGGYASPGMFGNNDNDKTMLRPSGPQGGLGMVRVEEGKEPGRVYEVRKEELSIGRSRESDIFLEDLAVSRLHAKIVSLGNGNYALKDEGSANGTKVNGQLVNKYQTYPLQEGDKIQLGQTVLVFARR